MNATTLCPHCNTRFRISDTQIVLHRGMVRCGNCLRVFDAHTGYIGTESGQQPAYPPTGDYDACNPRDEAGEAMVSEAGSMTEVAPSLDQVPTMTVPPAQDSTPENTCVHPDDLQAATSQPEISREEVLEIDTGHMAPPHYLDAPANIAQNADDVVASSRERRNLPWASASALLVMLLCAQAAYFFRVDLTANFPQIKPVLTDACLLVGCSIPLPQQEALMSIESSDIEAAPERANQMTLTALLRNHATFPQAFPNLELTLNDTQDKPLARRIFKPAEYLPAHENESAGLRPNHELSVKLYLDTTDLNPVGYRLALYYPRP